MDIQAKMCGWLEQLEYLMAYPIFFVVRLIYHKFYKISSFWKENPFSTIFQSMKCIFCFLRWTVGLDLNVNIGLSKIVEQQVSPFHDIDLIQEKSKMVWTSYYCSWKKWVWIQSQNALGTLAIGFEFGVFLIYIFIYIYTWGIQCFQAFLYRYLKLM